MTEISQRYDIGNTYEHRDLYAPDGAESRGPEAEALTCHAPEPAQAEPPTPGTAELVKAYTPARTSSAVATSDSEIGNPTAERVCDLVAAAAIAQPALLLGYLGCAMVFNPGRDAAAPQVDNARGAIGTGGRDYALPSGTGGVSGK
jgi:hypothetical protein